METIMDVLLRPTHKEKKVISAERGYIIRNGVVTTSFDKPKPEPIFPMLHEFLFKEPDEKKTTEKVTDRKAVLVG